MNKIGLSVQGKQLAVFATMIKPQLSEENKNVGKLKFTPGSLAAFQNREIFWQADEIGGNMNQSDILESVMKYANIREIHMTQWTNIFPMTDAGYKITVE